MNGPDHISLTEQNIVQLTASLVGLDPEKRPALARDVLAAARMTVGAAVRPRDLAILERLRKLRKAAATRTVGLEEISDDLCPALGIEDPTELADLLAAPDQFVTALSIAIAEFASNPETVRNRRGGRRRDPRIDNFAYRLAQLYRKHVRKRPTFTQETDFGVADKPVCGVWPDGIQDVLCPLSPCRRGPDA